MKFTEEKLEKAVRAALVAAQWIRATTRVCPNEKLEKAGTGCP